MEIPKNAKTKPITKQPVVQPRSFAPVNTQGLGTRPPAKKEEKVVGQRAKPAKANLDQSKGKPIIKKK